MPLQAYNPIPVTDANVIAFFKTGQFASLFTATLASSPGQDAPLEAIANAVSSSYPVPNGPLSAATFETLYDPTEQGTFTTALNSAISRRYAAGNIVVANSNIQGGLNADFANYPKSLANIQAQYTQPGSPWEYTFGVGQQATTSVIDHARNSGAGNNF